SYPSYCSSKFGRESRRSADAWCCTADTARGDIVPIGRAGIGREGTGLDTGPAPSRQTNIAATELFPASCLNNDAFFDCVGYRLYNASMNRAVLLVFSVTAWAQTPIVSPEVHADNTVTFRFRSPYARVVSIAIEGAKPAPMQLVEKEIWTYTTPAMAPDIYGYTFNVDGVTL